MTTVVNPRADTARELAESLAVRPDVIAVCLFGSLARGDEEEWSDIDLLVVGLDEELRPTLLLRALPERFRSERISLVCYSADELERLFEAGSSFVDHLRHEGKILFDPHGILERLLHGPFEPRLTIADELEAELARLKIYDDLTLFNDNFLFPLAQIYAIGKAVVILGLLAEGTREFSRERAFSTFRARHPEVADALEKVAALRPFYRRVTRRRPEPVPFAHKGAGRRVEEAVAAVRRVAAAIE